MIKKLFAIFQEKYIGYDLWFFLHNEYNAILILKFKVKVNFCGKFFTYISIKSKNSFVITTDKLNPITI